MMYVSSSQMNPADSDGQYTSTIPTKMATYCQRSRHDHAFEPDESAMRPQAATEFFISNAE
jgi:hypothetical protein